MRIMIGATPATLTRSLCRTPSAMPAATPASTALPPALNISNPAWVASPCPDEIANSFPAMTGRCLAM